MSLSKQTKHIFVASISKDYVIALVHGFDKENTEKPILEVFDVGSWLNENIDHAQKRSIAQLTTGKTEKSYNLSGGLNCSYRGLSAGVTPVHQLQYQEDKLRVTYFDKENGDSISPVQRFENIIVKQFFCHGSDLIIDGTIHKQNLSELVLSELKNQDRYKDYKIIKSLLEKETTITVSKSHTEDKLVFLLDFGKESISLIGTLDCSDLSVKILTSRYVSISSNIEMPSELPVWVETTSDNEVLFFEQTPYEFSFETSTYQYRYFYIRMLDKKKNIKGDISAVFLPLKITASYFLPDAHFTFGTDSEVFVALNQQITPEEDENLGEHGYIKEFDEGDIFSHATFITASVNGLNISQYLRAGQYHILVDGTLFSLYRKNGTLSCKPFEK